MKKMDLHIHTVSTKRDKPFAFSIEKLKGYVIQEKVDLIAITNHNLFDAQQFSDITNGVDSLLKDISKTIPVIIATHNNTIGVSVHPDYIVYACKEVLSDGKLEYHLYSGYPSSEDLVDLKGNHISRKSVLLDCLEAGEAAYMDRRNSYEILNG